MNTMIKPYPYKLMQKYPGMMKRDEVLWDAFVMQNPDAFEQVYYNVPLGDPFPEETTRAQAKWNGAYEVSQWRIDVVGYTTGRWFIIEVKPNAGAGALGQAVAYTNLFQKEYEITEPITPAVLTDEITPILQEAAGQLRVSLYVA